MQPRTRTIFLRGSLIASSLIVIFWVIYRLMYGEVPTVTVLVFSERWGYTLPFGISRWWDILMGPIFGGIWAHVIMEDSREYWKEDWLSRWIQTLIIGGLVLGLSLGLGFGGLALGLSAGLVYLLGVGLVCGIAYMIMKIIYELSCWGKIGNWLLAK